MVRAVVLEAVLCDASQYLVISVRNKLVYSQYIRSLLTGEFQSLLQVPLKVQQKSIRNPAAPVIAYFVLLCYFLTVP